MSSSHGYTLPVPSEVVLPTNVTISDIMAYVELKNVLKLEDEEEETDTKSDEDESDDEDEDDAESMEDEDDTDDETTAVGFGALDDDAEGDADM